MGKIIILFLIAYAVGFGIGLAIKLRQSRKYRWTEHQTMFYVKKEEA